jgi:hypothetical protein
LANGLANAAEPIEAALADALTRAAAEGRFDIVAQLARELEARRLARAGNVIAPEFTQAGRIGVPMSANHKSALLSESSPAAPNASGNCP